MSQPLCIPTGNSNLFRQCVAVSNKMAALRESLRMSMGRAVGILKSMNDTALVKSGMPGMISLHRSLSSGPNRSAVGGFLDPLLQPRIPPTNYGIRCPCATKRHGLLEAADCVNMLLGDVLCCMQDRARADCVCRGAFWQVREDAGEPDHV